MQKQMIYIKIRELIEEKSALWGREVTIKEVAIATGISRMTLFRIMKNQGYCTVTDHIDRLCDFFECELHELVIYEPNPTSKQNVTTA